MWHVFPFLVQTPSVLSCFYHRQHTLFFSMHMPPSAEYVSCALIEWLWSARSPAQWKFKLLGDLCKLHLVQGCYKLGSLFSLWCQQNGSCQELWSLGNVSYQGWGSQLSWSCAQGTDKEKWETSTSLDKFMITSKASNSAPLFLFLIVSRWKAALNCTPKNCFSFEAS